MSTTCCLCKKNGVHVKFEKRGIEKKKEFTRPKCKVEGLKMGQNEPTSTKAPSIESPLCLSCEWTLIKLISSFTLVTHCEVSLISTIHDNSCLENLIKIKLSFFKKGYNSPIWIFKISTIVIKYVMSTIKF